MQFLLAVLLALLGTLHTNIQGAPKDDVTTTTSTTPPTSTATLSDLLHTKITDAATAKIPQKNVKESCLWQSEAWDGLRFIQQTLSNVSKEIHDLLSHKNGDKTVSMATLWSEVRALNRTIGDLLHNLSSFATPLNIAETEDSNVRQENVRGNLEDIEERFSFAILSLWFKVEKLSANMSHFQAMYSESERQCTCTNYTDLETGPRSNSELVDLVTILQVNVSDLSKQLATERELAERLTEEIKNISLDFDMNDNHQQESNLPKSNKKYKEQQTPNDVVGKFNGVFSNQVEPESSVGHPPKTSKTYVSWMREINQKIEDLTNLVKTQQEILDTLQNVTRESSSDVVQQVASPGVDALQTSMRVTKETCNGERRHLVGKSCYYVPPLGESDKLYSWWDARYLCKRPEVLGSNADLVSIETVQEMNVVMDLLMNHFGGIEEFWLGGNDLDTEGTWVWAGTGQALSEDSYMNWAVYPTVNRARNCMSMLRGYKWAEEPCFYERYPLCELEF